LVIFGEEFAKVASALYAKRIRNQAIKEEANRVARQLAEERKILEQN
jgi:hypothetical protein